MKMNNGLIQMCNMANPVFFKFLFVTSGKLVNLCFPQFFHLKMEIISLLIVFHWSACLFLFQYHIVLITVGLPLSFKQGKCVLSNFVLFSILFWLFWVSYISIKKLGSASQFLQKVPAGILTWIILNLWSFGGLLPS